MPHINVWANERAPQRYRGRVLGALGLSFFLGQFASPIVLQPVVAKLGLGGSYGLLGAVLLAGALSAVGVGRRGR